jgi:vancomycin resistance protein VanJ
VSLVLLALGYLAGFITYLVALGLGWLHAGWPGVLRELTLYVFVPVPCLLLAAVLLRSRWTLALMLLPLAVFAWFYGPQFLPRAPAEPPAPSFRVLTFNAGGNEGGGQAEPLVRLLRAECADVVTLQEIPSRTLEILAVTLREEYPFQVGTRDTATLSRFPLLDVTEFRLDEDGYWNQDLEVEIDGLLVRLINVHVRRPASGVSLRRVWSWARNYNADWRDAQVEALTRQIRMAEGPQLVTGDFNQTDWSPSYGLVAAELRDSYREVGWGFGHTFPSHLGWTQREASVPLLRIDYIFHSPDLVARSARVGPASGSHHLPVIVDLGFR